MAKADKDQQKNVADKMAAVDESLAMFQQLAELNIAGGSSTAGTEEEGGGLPAFRQMKKIREDQVQNNAGGFVFQVDDVCRVRRFLILGTDGGTYYVSERKLTMSNLEALIQLIRNGRGGMILREIVEISLAGRAPKQDALLFALALCARYKVKDRKAKGMANMSDEERKFEQYLLQLQKAAMLSVNKVCRIPTHLFAFVKYCELIAQSTADDGTKSEEKEDKSEEKEDKELKAKNSTGWGRAMRKCVAEWYLQKPPKQLAMHLTKYQNREGWTHRDLLRLSHPMASHNNKELCNRSTLVYDQMFHYACTGEFDETRFAVSAESWDSPEIKRCRSDYGVTEKMAEYAENSEALEFIRRVKEASDLKKDEYGEKRCVELIQRYGLVREHIPTELLNSPKVWVALLQNMPMTALLRNLSKLATLGLLDEKEPENTQHVDLVISKLLEQEALHRARIHPIAVLLAASVFNQGHGIKGKLTWKVNERVKKALDECFLLAFKNVQPTGKRYCLALDVSGSMTSPINGGVLSCREASAAMANVTLRTEEHVECVAFCDKLTPLPFKKDTGVQEMVNKVSRLSFGATDCGLPMLWAKKAEKKFDVFIVYTDNETWAGEVHPFEALHQYRTAMELPGAKLVVMGMAATEFTIADPKDPGMMDIVGLDASVPELLRAFVMDEI